MNIENENDYFLKLKSESKAIKEGSMHRQFKQRFENGLGVIKK